MRGNDRKVKKRGHVERKCFPFNVACLMIGVRPLIRHALRRATFPVGEGDLRRGIPPAGAFPYLPLGEGGRLSGRKRGGTGSDPVPPHTRPCGATLSKQERAGESPRRKRGGTRSDTRTAPHPSGPLALPPSPRREFVPTPGPAAPVHPLLRRGFFQAIYASRSDSFLTIREVMRNSTATKAKKPHWALVVSEVAMKS